MEKNTDNLELLGHLGIVAAVMQDIQLVEKIDQLLPIAKEKGAH